MSTFSCCGDRSGGEEVDEVEVPAAGDCSGVTYMPEELSESKRWRSSSSSRYVPLPPPPSSSGGLPLPPAPTTKQPSQAQPNKHKPCTGLRPPPLSVIAWSSFVLLLCPPPQLLFPADSFKDVYRLECIRLRYIATLIKYNVLIEYKERADYVFRKKRVVFI